MTQIKFTIRYRRCETLFTGTIASATLRDDNDLDRRAKWAGRQWYLASNGHGIAMTMLRARPVVVEALNHASSCTSCDARLRSVCNAVPVEDLKRLADLATPLNVEAGRTFIEEGDAPEHFFNVTRGTAKLFKLLPDGRRQITGFAGVGHFLGLAVSQSYAFSAEAVDSMRVCRFSRSKLRVLLDDFPAMETRLLEVASNELVAAQEQMLLLGRKTARERLASFLVSLATPPLEDAPACAHTMLDHVSLPMTRGDIADFLGLTIETVSRTFTRLKLERLIEIPSSSEIRIRDANALEALAAGSA